MIRVLKNVRKEMQKVVWPTKEYMIKFSLVTILMCLLLALYFFGVDAIFAFIKGFR